MSNRSRPRRLAARWHRQVRTRDDGVDRAQKLILRTDRCGRYLVARADQLSEGNVPIPLKGQGNPLPPNFPYCGEWILEPRMFLYIPDRAQSTASSAPRFTASLNDNSDDWCLGFDSEQLATALNITADSLFQANRHRELTLENVEASTPDGEMALIKRYTFRVGASKASLSVQTLGQAGSA
jgi:hypothetical protein